MGFSWLGTFRQGQWKAYRRFVLNERRDVGRRMAVIDAELGRIGRVTVYYGQTEQGITEERTGFGVSAGSTLERLFQAYTAQGGNPFDVSLFLTPDSTYVLDSTSGVTFPTQPYDGVVYTKSQVAGTGGRDVGGDLVVRKYWPARAGGSKQFADASVVESIQLTRKFVNQTITTRLYDLEARIIKQADLREQLLLELETLTMAVGGTIDAIPVFDGDLYDITYGVAKIVTSIDSIFYVVDANGVPDLNSVRPDASPNQGSYANLSYQTLFKDFSPDEDNTAL